MKSKNILLILVVLVSALEASAGGSSTVGPSNPAAVNCLYLGGALERTENSGGQDANCVIDQWKLFKEMSDRGLVKEHIGENLSIPNPAALNCLEIKGNIRLEETLAGQKGLCVVAQWDLFRAINILDEN